MSCLVYQSDYVKSACVGAVQERDRVANGDGATRSAAVLAELVKDLDIFKHLHDCSGLHHAERVFAAAGKLILKLHRRK